MINAIDHTSPNGVASLCCDDDTDLDKLPEYAKSNNLKQGSTCFNIETSVVYMMKSDYTWKDI